MLILTHQQQTAFENIVGKGEIAHNEQFLLFPTMFSTQSDNCIPICPYFDISLFAAESEGPKIGISGKWLIQGVIFNLQSTIIVGNLDKNIFCLYGEGLACPNN